MLKLISLLFLFSSLEAATKFVILSPPKCGTHLITKALVNLLDKKETSWLGDMPPIRSNKPNNSHVKGGLSLLTTGI